MTDVIVDQLRALESPLRAAGIKALYLFGSHARREARPDSDVDLLFEVDPLLRFSLLDQARLQVDLSDTLRRTVDFIERRALRPSIRKRAETEMIQVF